MRARGLNFSASAGAVGSVIVAQIWPVGVDRLGSNVYFFFMAVNLACIPVSPVPPQSPPRFVCSAPIILTSARQIIYMFYPETKGVSLEDMDELFGRLKGPARPQNENGAGGDAPDGSVSQEA